MVGCCGSVVVTRLQGVYNQRRPCDDGGGAKGGDGRDEREATAETKGRRRQRRKGGDGRDEREATASSYIAKSSLYWRKPSPPFRLCRRLPFVSAVASLS